jgi:alpha-tubulin suppressor-like RCC1 family protein
VVGNSFACALLDSGHVECWGEGDIGQLGDGNENDSNNTPVSVQDVSDAVQLAAGRNHVCALRRDGTVVCWGDGESGQLGDGVFHDGYPNWVKTPVRATAFSDVIEVSCGGNHTCVRTSTNAVKCVGGGEHGQLGNGTFYEKQPFGSATAVDALSL